MEIIPAVESNDSPYGMTIGGNARDRGLIRLRHGLMKGGHRTNASMHPEIEVRRIPRLLA